MSKDDYIMVNKSIYLDNPKLSTVFKLFDAVYDEDVHIDVKYKQWRN